MYDDSRSIRIALEQWEWDVVDAEARACGMTRAELLHELVVEGIAFDMAQLSSTGDSQWKSH